MQAIFTLPQEIYASNDTSYLSFDTSDCLTDILRAKYHQTPQLKAAARACVEGMELLDFDGCSEILVDSIEKAMEFFKSPEYVQRMNGESLSYS